VRRDRSRDSAAGPVRRRMPSSHGHALAGFGAALATALLATCMTKVDPPVRPVPDWAEADAPLSSVLVRGRIFPGGLVLEPVFQIHAPPSVRMEQDGKHRLRGIDDEGGVLFDLRFDGVEVADVTTGPEEHFSFVIPVGPEGTLRIERVELQAADSRQAVRTSRLSAQELLDALEREDAVMVERAAEGRVRVRWDADLFPDIMITDPGARMILAFARQGDATLMTELTALAVTPSEGVRSFTRTFQVW